MTFHLGMVVVENLEWASSIKIKMLLKGHKTKAHPRSSLLIRCHLSSDKPHGTFRWAAVDPPAARPPFCWRSTGEQLPIFVVFLRVPTLRSLHITTNWGDPAASSLEPAVPLASAPQRIACASALTGDVPSLHPHGSNRHFWLGHIALVRKAVVAGERPISS